MAFGSELVVTDGAALTVKLKFAVAKALVASVTFAVKLLVPFAVGVPEIAPALERVNPAGRLPALMVHESGDVPPLAAKVWL